MGDDDGPAIANSIYEALLEGEVLNLDAVPYALDEAVGALREKGVPPSRWATFIHIGI
jgi:hypothetical protein